MTRKKYKSIQKKKNKLLFHNSSSISHGFATHHREMFKNGFQSWQTQHEGNITTQIYKTKNKIKGKTQLRSLQIQPESHVWAQEGSSHQAHATNLPAALLRLTSTAELYREKSSNERGEEQMQCLSWDSHFFASHRSNVMSRFGRHGDSEGLSQRNDWLSYLCLLVLIKAWSCLPDSCSCFDGRWLQRRWGTGVS